MEQACIPNFSTYYAMRDVSPSWHLYDLNAHEGCLKFISMNESCYQSSIFLDHRVQRPNQNEMITPIPLIPSVKAGSGHYLFHSSFCGSTLIASVLQHPDTFLALKEPTVLWRISGLKQNPDLALSDSQLQQLLKVSLSSLCESFHSNQQVVIKPTNLASNLIEDIRKVQSDARMVLLYDDLQSYIVSYLKKPVEGRHNFELIAKHFIQSSPIKHEYDRFLDQYPGDYLACAMVSWHAQLFAFQQHLETASDNMVSVSFTDILKSPKLHISTIARFYRPELTMEKLEKELNWAALKLDAKQPNMAYSPAKRAEDRALVERRCKNLMDQAWDQFDPLLNRFPIPVRLDHDLLQPSCSAQTTLPYSA